MPDYDSPFFITNDRTYIDQAAIEDGTADVWPLSDDAKLRRSPERQYCGNYVTYGDKGAATYRHNADTHDLIAAGPNQHRDMVSSFPMVKTKAKAQARGDRQLLDVQEQDVRITTRLVDIPSTRVTLAKPGMRLQVLGTHWWPSCETWHYARIVSAQPQPHSDGSLYDIDLELVLGDESEGPPVPPPPQHATSGGILYQPGTDPTPATSFAIFWGSTGDDPGAGYGSRPRDAAAFDYIGVVPTVGGWEILAEVGELDLAVQISVSDAIGSPRTYTFEVLLNGTPVGSDAETVAGPFVGIFLNVDITGLAVVAGDQLTTRLLTSELAGCVVPWGTGDLTNRFEIVNTSTVSA